MPSQSRPLPWLAPNENFPAVEEAWGATSPAPGLLAAGGVLDVDTLVRAYGKGIFPWFNENQPTLWWSPDPRMVLDVADFRIHPSLRKTLHRFRKSQSCVIRLDTDFGGVIQACSTSLRDGQAGTWIVPEMIAAYDKLHRAGLAHSVETWIDGELVGGLYCVALGKSVFGESMFSRSTDASKIALAALVGFCRHHAIQQIDCQQYTRHLASLGAREIPRNQFLKSIEIGRTQMAPVWQFDEIYWPDLLPSKSTET